MMLSVRRVRHCCRRWLSSSTTPQEVVTYGHESVLRNEIVSVFANHLDEILAARTKKGDEQSSVRLWDGTLGAGGHAVGMVDSLLKKNGAWKNRVHLIGSDQDEYALTLAEQNLKPWMGDAKIDFVHGNFSSVVDSPTLQRNPVDAILLDLGVSSMQLDDMSRGFSFRGGDYPLDMRMNRKNELTAQTVINEWPQSVLEGLLRDFGGERNYRKIAARIIAHRQTTEIKTTSDLLKAIGPVLSWQKGHRIHPATRTFQAIRIAVNNELYHLKLFLEKVPSILNSGGIMGIISFHSGEDGQVKDFLKTSKSLTSLRKTKQPILPSSQEIEANPRSRSAKLRIGIRK